MWEEVRTQFHNDIASAVLKDTIPDELILNIDQTPSKFVPTENVMMAETGSEYVSRKGGNDKRGITVTLLLGFCLSYNPKHWSNEYEMINLLESVVDLYFCQVREELGLPNDQKALILWDGFKAQLTDKVTKELKSLNIVQVMVPKNMNHLLQPLDLTTNSSVKKT